jgi:hypothetical protein
MKINKIMIHCSELQRMQGRDTWAPLAETSQWLTETDSTCRCESFRLPFART